MSTVSLRAAVRMIMLPVLALAAPALAESPQIAKQHEEYLAAKKVWEEKHLPSGLAHSGAFTAQEKDPAPRASGTGRTTMLLNDVDFFYAGGIGFAAKRLIITLEPKTPGQPLNLDRVDSFIIRLHQGEVTLHSDALSELFNKHILAYKSAPLAKMKMKTGDNRLSAAADLVTAHAAGGVRIPASFAGSVTLTPDNKLMFKVDEVKGLGISLGSVMKSLGITLPKVVAIKRPGIAVSDFSIAMDHRHLFPPPELAGNIAGVRLRADGLHLTFNDAPKAELNPPAFLNGSYIWIQSGDPEFYGAVITNARIAMVPAREKARLRFDLYGYRKLLAAGETKISPDGTMVVRLP